MKLLLEILCGCLTVMLTAYSAYFLIVTVIGLLRHRHAPTPAEAKTRFVCVIAARNEAGVVGHLVDSLYAQEYPRELYRVVVAPNNCTDETAAVAAQHGAELFFAHGEVRGKGDVLTQMTDALLEQGDFDAMCVLDADNLVERHFLQRMNDAMQSGAEVAQGYRDSKNPCQSAVSGSCSIGFWLLNVCYNECRHALGLSALVNGSGFVVARTVLEKLGGWHTTTMTEDYEFSAQCACAGVPVAYVKGARFYDEQPVTFAQSWRQRRRWTTGSLQGFMRYHGALLLGALRGSTMCADMYLTFLLPIVQLLGVFAAASGMAFLLAKGTVMLGTLALRSVWVVCGLTAISAVLSIAAAIVVAAGVVAHQKVSLRKMAGAICSFWVYLASSAVLMLLSFVHRETQWKAMEHTACLPPESMEV